MFEGDDDDLLTVLKTGGSLEDINTSEDGLVKTQESGKQKYINGLAGVNYEISSKTKKD